MEGQISIFDYTKPVKSRTLNDYWNAEMTDNPIRLTKDELASEQRKLGNCLGMWFLTDVPKCCGCYPVLKRTSGWLKQLCYAECIVCGKKTKPVDDYSWIHTREEWICLMSKLKI